MTGSNGTKDKENRAHKPGDQLRANLKKRKAQASKRANIKANNTNLDSKAEKAKGK